MRTRGAAIQGGLAALGLLLAWATWQREPERAPGEATLIDVSKSDISKVRYEDGAKWVELEQKPASDQDGKLAPYLHVAPKASPAPAPERYVRGNAGADKLLDKLAPLHATRALGVLGPDKLKEFGLDAPKKKLIISARGSAHVYDIGTSPYGVSDPYVKDEKDNRVYVLGQSIISDLDSASVRLVDRTLHAFKPAEWDGLTVTLGAKKRELAQQSGEKPMESKLVGKKSGKPDAQAKNWHDKVFRLVVSDVLGQGEKPQNGEPQTVLKLEYSFHGKSVGWLEIGRVAPAATSTQASTPPVTAGGELYAKSEHSAGWMKLAGTAEDVIKEADKVVAGE